MLNLISFLIIFPILAALILLFTRNNSMRKVIVVGSSALIILATLVMMLLELTGQTHFFAFESIWIDKAMFVIEGLIALLILYLSIKHRKFGVTLLILIQTILMTLFEFKYGPTLKPAHNLFLDSFSLVMTLIIGIIGTLICIHAVGYMKEFHEHHPEFKDRRPYFFFILFAFLSAMFGIVFANNLLWLFFFWEITTLSSFLLIGYKQDQISINNSFRALFMNLIGGVCFVLGIIYLYLNTGVIELDRMLLLSKGAVLIPLMLLSIAGLSKSAQLPFSSWLIGAMVAPTPVSALLHSAAMVKAGVYLLIKLSALYAATTVGLLVAFVGGVTFVLASFIAISQSDAKKILAYSTIANLGLIVLCAGVGGYQALWAGILLIIFHALAKALLFLCVGVVEHKTGSRDVESMDGLIQAMPRVAWMMLVGMAGMFLAPFGMLISKWAVLIAVVQVDPIFTILILFGGAATLFFWVKWMGKILTVLQPRADIENTVSKYEWSALFTLAVLTIGLCLFFPLVSNYLIEPYIVYTYGTWASLGSGNIIIMIMMMGLMLLFGLTIPIVKRKTHAHITSAYLAGANIDSPTAFTDSFGATHEYTFKNYYLDAYFNEKKLSRSGVIISCLIIAIMVASVIPWHS